LTSYDKILKVQQKNFSLEPTKRKPVNRVA
jgi:hypothetical protein